MVVSCFGAPTWAGYSHPSNSVQVNDVNGETLHFTFDDPAPLIDRAASGVATILVGEAQIVANGRRGKALAPSSHGGMGIGINLANQLLPRDSTLSVWVRRDGNGAGDMNQDTPSIIGNWADASGAPNFLFIGLRSDNRWGVQVGSGGPVMSPNPLPSGQWTHLAVTRVAATGQVTLFVNGSAVGSGNAGTTSNVGRAFTIGRTDTTITGFPGAIDEVRLFNHSLNATQVAALAADTTPPPAPPVLADGWIRLSSPMGGKVWTTQSLTLVAETGGGSPVEQVRFLVNGSLVAQATPAANNTWSASWTPSGPGVFSLTAERTDASGVKRSNATQLEVADSSSLRPPDVATAESGSLDYEYFHGAYSILPNFASLTPLKTGTTANIDRSMRERDTNYAIRFHGFVHVTEPGNHRFTLNSDDGSRLWIGNDLVVDNDGSHGPISVTGNRDLALGWHAITIGYFQGGGGAALSASWSGPGFGERPLAGADLGRAATGNPGDPINQPPLVNAGPDRSVLVGATANLSGTVADDGLPVGGTLTTTWSQQSGPGQSAIANPAAASTTATFPIAGTYILRLSANDGILTASDTMTVTVTAPPAGDPLEGYTLVANEGQSYTFNEVVDVAYGAQGQYVFRSGMTGTITFNNATFGDPIPGVVKSGYYRPIAPPPPVTYADAAPSFAWGPTPLDQRGPQDNPDGDRYNNFLTWALGGSFFEPDGDLAPQQISRNVDGTITFRQSYFKAVPDLLYQFKWSTNLTVWYSTGVTPEQFDPATGLHYQLWTTPVGSDRAFGRLEITEP